MARSEMSFIFIEVVSYHNKNEAFFTFRNNWKNI